MPVFGIGWRQVVVSTREGIWQDKAASSSQSPASHFCCRARERSGTSIAEISQTDLAGCLRFLYGAVAVVDGRRRAPFDRWLRVGRYQRVMVSERQRLVQDTGREGGDMYEDWYAQE